MTSDELKVAWQRSNRVTRRIAEPLGVARLTEKIGMLRPAGKSSASPLFPRPNRNPRGIIPVRPNTTTALFCKVCVTSMLKTVT